MSGMRLDLRAFNEEQVLEIRNIIADDPNRVAELAERFNCVWVTITNICAHLSYPDFGGPKVERKGRGVSRVTVTYPDGSPPILYSGVGPTFAAKRHLYRVCFKCYSRLFKGLVEANQSIPPADSHNVMAGGTNLCLACAKHQKEVHFDS